MVTVHLPVRAWANSKTLDLRSPVKWGSRHERTRVAHKL